MAWLIVNDEDDRLYWSNTEGWVTKGYDSFSEEIATLNLPIGGHWAQFLDINRLKVSNMNNIPVDSSWKQIIAKAEKRGSFTQQQRSASGSWTTCAVGELLGFGPSYIRTNNMGRVLSPTEEVEALHRCHMHPQYAKLDQLGIEFYHAVRDDEVSQAKIIFAQIEQLKQS